VKLCPKIETVNSKFLPIIKIKFKFKFKLKLIKAKFIIQIKIKLKLGRRQTAHASKADTFIIGNSLRVHGY